MRFFTFTLTKTINIEQLTTGQVLSRITSKLTVRQGQLISMRMTSNWH